jgi:hypothetical protein
MPNAQTSCPSGVRFCCGFFGFMRDSQRTAYSRSIPATSAVIYDHRILRRIADNLSTQIAGDAHRGNSASGANILVLFDLAYERE